MKYHPLSHGEIHISFLNFKVTFSFSHLACLDQKWKAKTVDELQSNAKKETFDIPKKYFER